MPAQCSAALRPGRNRADIAACRRDGATALLEHPRPTLRLTHRTERLAGLLWTVPFPLYGIFRYLYLVHQREGGGNPSELLVTDRPLLACVAVWGLAVIAILYGPWR